MEEFFGSDRFELIAHMLGKTTILFNVVTLTKVVRVLVTFCVLRREVGRTSTGVQGQNIGDW